MKKSRVYTRKRLALHWILLALVFLLSAAADPGRS